MPYREDNGPPMFTYAMMAVFIAFFGAEYSQTNLTQFFAFPWRVADGELWRLITCTFLHGSVIHFLMNVALFFRFSSVIDDWLGPWGALVLYGAYGASASAAQLLVSAGPYGLAGASGVVYGLFGFLWVMSRRRDDAAQAAGVHTAQFLLGWIVICAVINAFGGNIANTAHVWGLLLGWLTGQTFVARRKWRWPLAAGTVILWALPLVLVNRPVWEATFGRDESVGLGEGAWHMLDMPEEIRREYERSAEQFRPGFL